MDSSSSKRRDRTVIAGLFLIAVGLAHSVWPESIKLDWPAVALVVAGALLCFAGRASSLLPYIKRVKVGEAEIELQEKVNDMRQNVEELDEKEPKKPAFRKFSDDIERTLEDYTDVESKILELAVADREAALIRLSIEIEKELGALCKKVGFSSITTWRNSVSALLHANVIEPPLAKALLEFRDVRNRVIHSGLRKPVRQAILIRAIDDGLIMFRHLKASG